MVQKAKAALGIPISCKLPRCQAKSVGKARKLDKELGYEFHGKKHGHICDECRCGFRAGYGTAHLGYGLCITHENSVKYAAKSEEIKENQLRSIQQGYTNDENWEYAVADPDGYVAKMRSVG